MFQYSNVPFDEEHLVPLLFRHSQIFGDNFPVAVIFPVQLTCDHLDCQPMIPISHQPYPLNVDLSSACWRPPVRGVFFHHLAPFFKPLLPLKNVYARHSLSPYFCCSLLTDCDGVFVKQDQQFLVHLLLSVHCSFPDAHSWTTGKSESVKKHMKKVMVSENQDCIYILPKYYVR